MFLAVLTLLTLSAAGFRPCWWRCRVFTALKIVGAGYLLYLGYRSWRAEAPIDLAAADGPVQVPSPWRCSAPAS
jgi:threonine/homoserine/homoserine lactone efflux protein